MAEETKRPIRILHVVGGMNVGGVETWLMQVLRNIDRDRYRMDFLVHTDRPCVYDEEIRTFGSAIIPCLRPSNPALYAYNFLRILKQHGPYDVVHSHVHHFSGLVVWLARLAGVPNRVVHSHNDTSSLRASKKFLRERYLRGTEYLINECSTAGLACSRQAAEDLYGGGWEEDGRWRLLYCGIDLRPFQQPVDRLQIRKEFGLSEKEFVIGHVGRFDQQKNHNFLIDIFSEIAIQESRARLLLVGDGPLRKDMKKKVSQLGLEAKVFFAGLRSDVPRLMKGTMDAFVFPSLFEGLGLVLIEAQAAGLPCLITDSLPVEVDIVSNAIKRMDLASPPDQWATAILDLRKNRLCKQEAIASLEKSKFNLTESICDLRNIYNVN